MDEKGITSYHVHQCCPFSSSAMAQHLHTQWEAEMGCSLFPSTLLMKCDSVVNCGIPLSLSSILYYSLFSPLFSPILYYSLFSPLCSPILYYSLLISASYFRAVLAFSAAMQRRRIYIGNAATHGNLSFIDPASHKFQNPDDLLVSL